MKFNCYMAVLLCFGCRSIDQKIIKESSSPEFIYTPPLVSAETYLIEQIHPSPDINPSHAIMKQVFTAKSRSEPLVIIDTSIQPWYISWGIEGDNTNMPQDGIEFDVEKTDSIENPIWTLYCQTNQPPVPFYFTNNQGFFRVGAHLVTIPMPAPFGP